MGYFGGNLNQERYVVKTENIPSPIDYKDGIKLFNIDTGLKYISSDGVWVLDKCEYNGSSYNSNEELVNTSDAYYDSVLTSEDITTRYFRQGYVYGAGYTWSNVADNATKNLHIYTGDKSIYLEFSMAGVGLLDYGLVSNPSISADGSSVSIFNRNPEMGKQSTTSLFTDATYSGGDIAIPRFLGTAGNIFQRSGGSAKSQEAILTKNSHYVIYLTNSSGSSQVRAGVYLDWLEIEV